MDGNYRISIVVALVFGMLLVAAFNILPETSDQISLYFPVFAVIMIGFLLFSRRFWPGYYKKLRSNPDFDLKRLIIPLLGVGLFFSPSLIWKWTGGDAMQGGKSAVLGYFGVLLALKLGGIILIIIGSWMAWRQIRRSTPK